MDIEVGEYFVVTRGVELNYSGMGSLFGFLSFPPIDQQAVQDTTKHYDRSYNGMIYKVIEVCYPMVCCMCVANGDNVSYKEKDVGKVSSFNLQEIEIMPVTKKYVQAFGVEV